MLPDSDLEDKKNYEIRLGENLHTSTGVIVSRWNERMDYSALGATTKAAAHKIISRGPSRLAGDPLSFFKNSGSVWETKLKAFLARRAMMHPMADSEPLTKAQYETLASLRFALRQFHRFSEDAAAAAGLTPQHHQALLAIKGYPGRDYVSVGELAERLQIRHHSAVGLVDRLVTSELVRRESSETDKRQVHIRLTAKGERVLAQLAATHYEQLRRIGPEWSLLLRRLSGDEGKLLAEKGGM